MSFRITIVLASGERITTWKTGKAREIEDDLVAKYPNHVFMALKPVDGEAR